MPWDGGRGARLNVSEEGEEAVMSMARIGAEIQGLAMAVGFEPRNTKSFDSRSRQLKVETSRNTAGLSLKFCVSDLASNAALSYDPVQFQELICDFENECANTDLKDKSHASLAFVLQFPLYQTHLQGRMRAFRLSL